MTRQAMPSADAAWLHMDRPANPMVVNSLVLLGEQPDPEVVAETLERRLLGPYPKFRQRVVDPIARAPGFEDDPTFEIGNHLHRRALPAPADRAALEELVGDLITPPLDPNRPLWHAYLIEGCEGGGAILWRIHHCIADGIALSRVLLSLSDGAETGEAPAAPPPPTAPARLAAVPGEAVSAARALGAGLVHESMESLAHPGHLRSLVKTTARDVATAAKLLASPADPSSSLRAPLSGRRRVAWTEPLALAPIAEAGRRRRVTINDLLVTALAGALQARSEAGETLPEEIHAMVPVNLRPPKRPVAADLGNSFALILLALPVEETTPVERLREVSSRMNAIKRSHEAPISFGLLGAIGLTPPWVEDRLIGFFTGKASLVVTNVPGPRRRISFAGVPVDGILVWAPCSGSLGMTVSILSYGGEVTVGFMTDTAVVADPESLARAYEAQLRLLVPDAV